MNQSETLALARDAWNDHASMVTLCDYLDENNLIYIPEGKKYHESFRREMVLHIKEQSVRQWIIKSLGVKGRVDSIRFYPCPRLRNIAGRIKHLYYAFIVDGNNDDEVLVDVGLQNPAPFTLEYDGPVIDGGFDHLKQIFQNVKYGQHNYSQIITAINRHLDPTYMFFSRESDLEPEFES